MQASFTVGNDKCESGCEDLGGDYVLDPVVPGVLDPQYEAPTPASGDYPVCKWEYGANVDLICDPPAECEACACTTVFNGQSADCEPGVIECDQTYTLDKAPECTECEDAGCADGCLADTESECTCISNEASPTGYSCSCAGVCNCIPNCDKFGTMGIKVWLYRSADLTEWVLLVEITVTEKVYMGELTFAAGDGSFDCESELTGGAVPLTIQNDPDINELCEGPSSCSISIL